jgi:hypothetical protein
MVFYCRDFNMMSGMSLLKSLMVALSAMLIAVSSFAQEDEGLGNEPAAEEAPAAAPAEKSAAPQNQVQKGRRTTIDFEDELVEGKTKNPELFYLLQKRQFNYKRLIRLRENFLPEMRKTSEEMQRKGSAD